MPWTRTNWTVHTGDSPRTALPLVSQAGSLASTSSKSGKRPSCFLLKSSCPSSVTSNSPPLPRTSVASMPRNFLISAARLEARGR